MPINKYMRGNIPLVVSHFPVIILKFPEYLPLVGTNNTIEANNSPDFVFNNTNLTVYFYAALRTTRSRKIMIGRELPTG